MINELETWLSVVGERIATERSAAGRPTPMPIMERIQLIGIINILLDDVKKSAANSLSSHESINRAFRVTQWADAPISVEQIQQEKYELALDEPYEEHG